VKENSMTPQEQQLVADLFNRLASLEDQRRDADAERLIREGLGRAPNSVYTLVQTVLVQDEALKRANARIEELQRAAAGSSTTESGGSFLDSVRNLVGGGRSDPPRSSVPPVRGSGMGTSGVWGSSPGQGASAGQPSGQPWGNPSGYPQGGGYPPPPPPGYGAGYPGAPPMMGGGGGSFLGTAAASAAGVVGGAMLLNGIRSMMGPHETFSMGGHHDPSVAHDPSSYDTGSGEHHGHLADDAGAGDIGSHRSAAYDDDAGNDRDRYLGGSADDLAGNNDDFDDDDGGDFGGGDDFGGGGGDFDTA